MNNIFDKLNKKFEDIDFQLFIQKQNQQERFSWAENAVGICKKALEPYDAYFKSKDFVIDSYFNKHYFRFKVSDTKHNRIPDFEFGISEGKDKLPIFYFNTQNKQISTLIPDISLTSESFLLWLDNALQQAIDL